MLLSVAVFAYAMHGFKVENRGLNHARINSEGRKLTLEKKKKNTRQTVFFATNWLGIIQRKKWSVVEVGENTPSPTTFFCPHPHGHFLVAM